jgi:hypothetical protein
MDKNKQLPLFEDETRLPTGKNHISYSELFNWMECSYHHKLKHINKIDLDGASIHTAFGHVVHGALEQYVVTGKMPNVEECIEDFKKRLGELLFTDKAVTAAEAQEFIDAMPNILEQAPKFLDEEFPGWTLVAAEEYLFEPIEGQTNKYFKGFIDLVIKVPKRRKGKITRLSGLKGETVNGEWVYWLIDWKTTNWGWRAEQKRSFEKQMQLILYKHFWCQKMNVPLKEARCGYGFLRRKPRKDGTRIDVLPISVGPTAVEKALKQLHNALNQIQNKRFIKNKMSCRFCPYAGTVHCP